MRRSESPASAEMACNDMILSSKVERRFFLSVNSVRNNVAFVCGDDAHDRIGDHLIVTRV